MMENFKVVCIKDGEWLARGTNIPRRLTNPDAKNPSKGDICTVIGLTKNGFYILDGFDLAYNPIRFRPICDDGYVLCEWIEETHFKELELQEAIKQ